MQSLAFFSLRITKRLRFHVIKEPKAIKLLMKCAINNNFSELLMYCSICTYLKRKLQILRKPSVAL
nr:MAG TPA: hypothetical protein [Caudoviricetes sp.]